MAFMHAADLEEPPASYNCPLLIMQTKQEKRCTMPKLKASRMRCNDLWVALRAVAALQGEEVCPKSPCVLHLRQAFRRLQAWWTALFNAVVGVPRSPCLSACAASVQASTGGHNNSRLSQYLQDYSCRHAVGQSLHSRT